MLFTISYELYHIICVILKLCCILNIICYTLYVINYVSLYYILHRVVHCVFCLLHIFVPFIGIHKIQWQKRLFWLHKMKVSSTSQNIFPTLITFALSNPCCTHVKSDRNIIVSHRHCLCAVSAQWKEVERSWIQCCQRKVSLKTVISDSCTPVAESSTTMKLECTLGSQESE